jgi:cell division initiation protein
MISPVDIQNKEFTRGVRGYKEEEVDSFLDVITLDLEVLIQENRNLKGSLALLTQEVEKYRDSEKTVLETLEAAKGLMEDISKSSERKAEILIKNAEFDAERIVKGAKESVERLTEEAATLRNRISILKTRYKTLLETELERFDSLSAELFPEAFLDKIVTNVEDYNDVDQDASVSKNERLKTDPKTIAKVRT